MPEPLSAAEGATLLALARAAIEDALQQRHAVDAVLRRHEIGPALEARRGAFVTLRLPGEAAGQRVLRGCIGTMAADEPLYRAVINTAPRSALSDPRFPPLTGAELASLTVEVSALTPLEPLRSPDDLVIGRDGVQLIRDDRRSVFLPQVAVQQRWNATQLLEHLAEKAGLPNDGWRGAELSVFRAEVFEEGAE